MYAVIRAGGKQYRVAPGDIVNVERLEAKEGETVQFSDVLAVSAEQGSIGPGNDVQVSGQVVEAGRADKILVFHFKRKKQYKKIYGHRQPFTAVRITEIAFDGQKYKAPELPAAPKKKARPAAETSEAAEAPKAKAAAKSSGKSKAKPRAKKAAAKKPASKGKKK